MFLSGTDHIGTFFLALAKILDSLKENFIACINSLDMENPSYQFW